MLNEFPSFVPISDVSFADFSQALAGHLPYSTFNFVSVCCFWPNAELSRFGDGLALILTDPILRRPFLTFLSRTTNGVTLNDIKDLIAQRSLEHSLKLMPGCSLNCLAEIAHSIERRDDFDYLISVDTMLDQSAIPEKYARASSFSEKCQGFAIREIVRSDFRDEIRAVVASRRPSQEVNGDPLVEWECEALLRCIELPSSIDLITIAALDANGKMLGFTINEIASGYTYMAHFGRTLPGTMGLPELLELETARLMKSRGCKQMNLQEDHGDVRLRRMKTSWKPSRMLRVYDLQWQS